MVAGDSAKHRYNYPARKVPHGKMLSGNYPDAIRTFKRRVKAGVRLGAVWWALPCTSGLLLSGNYPDSIRAFKRRGAVGRGVVGATLHIWALTIRILSGYYPESRPQAAYPEHMLARRLQKTLLWCSGIDFSLDQAKGLSSPYRATKAGSGGCKHPIPSKASNLTIATCQHVSQAFNSQRPCCKMLDSNDRD